MRCNEGGSEMMPRHKPHTKHEAGQISDAVVEHYIQYVAANRRRELS